MTTKADDQKIDLEDIDDIVGTPDRHALDPAKAAEDAAAAKAAVDSQKGIKGKKKTAFAPRTDDLGDDDEDDEEDDLEFGDEGYVLKPGDEGYEEPDEDEEDEEGDEGGEASSEDKEFYAGLTKLLSDRGLLDVGEDTQIVDEKSFTEAWENEMTSRIDARVKAVESYMKVGVPFGTVSKIESAIAKTNAITPEYISKNPEIGKQLIIAEAKSRGFGEEQAIRYYNMIESSGPEALATETTTALNLRKASLSEMLQNEVATASKLKEAEQIKGDKLAEDLVKSVNSDKIFGRKVGAATRSKQLKILNTVAGTDESGDPINSLMKFKMENPVDFEHKLLYLFTITDGFKDLKAFDRSAETRVSRGFKDTVTVLNSGKSFGDNSSTHQKGKINIEQIDDIIV